MSNELTITIGNQSAVLKPDPNGGWSGVINWQPTPLSTEDLDKIVTKEYTIEEIGSLYGPEAQSFLNEEAFNE